jgi:2-dehydropantoate 2-reductase
MLEDVQARRRTEVDMITGSLVREARRLGVPIPRHESMYSLIKGVEASWE